MAALLQALLITLHLLRYCSLTPTTTAFPLLLPLPLHDHRRTRQLNRQHPYHFLSRSLFSASSSSSEQEVRAGDGGYSVLRQPANWNLDDDPTFVVPQRLDDDDDPRIIDEEWWGTTSSNNGQERRNGRPGQQQRPADKSFLQPPNIVEKEEELDLFQRSLDTLDWPQILQALYNECQTVPAKRIVQSAVDITAVKKQRNNGDHYSSTFFAYEPLLADQVDGCRDRYGALQEMTWILDGGNETHRISDKSYYLNRQKYKQSMAGRPPPITGGFNLDVILGESSGNKVLEGEDILQVAEMLNNLENALLWTDGLEHVEEFDFVHLPGIAHDITVNATLQDLLNNAFDDDNRLSGTTFPQIGILRATVKSLKADIMKTLQDMLPSLPLNLESGGPTISEVSGGRLVVPVEPKHASKLGNIHDTSRSGKTVYVEPHAIVAPTNEMRQALGELQNEEARVWKTLTQEIIRNQDDLHRSVQAIGQLDLVLAKLQLGRKLNGCVPNVQDEGVINIQNAKHPVLLLRGIDAVGSDIDFGCSNQGLVLTGPNAGGKTVILKLLGLVALMARSGIPVPANDKSQPRVDFFNPVLADIGDLQSVGGDLSTFSGHMLVCREVLNNSGRNALILMDELGSGTDPSQGVAIAQALLESVLETGARVAITTHYTQLKQLAASDDRFSVAGMQFVNGRPTYKLQPGTVGESFALAVAERLGLPQSVLNRANELLDSETRQMGDLIRELEDQKALVDQQAEEMEQKRKEMANMELQMKEERIRLERKQLGARRDKARKFAKMLEEKEAILEDVLEKLKSDPSRRLVAKSWDDIKFVKRDALNEAENVPSVVMRKQKVAQAMDEASAELVPIAELREKPDLNEGDTVVICKKGPMFGREASILKILGSRAEVKVNNMNVSFKTSQIALPPAQGGTLFQPNSRAVSTNAKPSRKASTSRAADRAIAAEGQVRRDKTNGAAAQTSSSSSSKVTMRTQSNTIDVRGCTLVEAQDMAKAKMSRLLGGGQHVLYILHGHGTGGVLKSKVRNWLRSEKDIVKSYGAADLSDGGDALTRVELR